MGKGLEQVIPANPASFTLKLPAKVKEAIAEGKTVVPVIQSGSGAKLSDLFVETGRSFFMSDGELTFTAKPKFNLIPTKELSYQESFGLNIKIKVPFIERKYGYNMYSVFGNGYSAVQINGWINRANPRDITQRPRGWIHPSMIADTKGTLKPGLELVVNSKYMPSDGFTVGQGTFSNAGALGLCFEYPVKFTFYVKADHTCNKCGDGLTSGTQCGPDTCPYWDTEDCGCYVPPTPPEPSEPEPPAPANPLCQKCGECELTEEGVCGSETCSRWDTENCGCYVPPDIDATAVLSLPPTTYIGHPVTATDQSTFTVDGEFYSAVRAYQEKIATNRFSIVESGAGSISKKTNLTAQAVFREKGTYNVRLRVTPKGSSTDLYDVKPIEVLKTPTVIVQLLGTQKQNRKQILNVSVATNPDNPLKELYVELHQPDSGEVVKLIHHLDGTENTLQNSGLIKTRPIEGLPSNEYFTNCKLEFLTKNTEEISMEYHVYARDSKGLWDEVRMEFRVVPDKAPVAAMELAPTHVREAGSNIAKIQARDRSTSDGDQLQRTWSVTWADTYNGAYDRYVTPAAVNPFANPQYRVAESLSGFADHSFGTKQSIQFDRAGVGKLQVKLQVKDVWTEETLEEYITDADYLRAETTAITEVVNIAPQVSLKAIQSRKADVLLLAGGEAEYQVLKKGASQLNSALLEQAIDATITVEKMSPKAGGSITYGQRFSITAPYGYQGSWEPFWEEESWAIDNYRLYKAEATWYADDPQQDSLTCYPHQPYTLYAYDASIKGTAEVENAPVWTYTLSEDILTAPDTKSAYFAHDAEGQYLYWVIADHTILIDKATGQQVAILPLSVGPYNTVANHNIYTFKTDGIYRISMADGSGSKLYSGTLCVDNVRRIGGKDHFVVVQSAIQLSRGVFNPQTERVELHRLPGSEHDAYATRYTLCGIDADGRLLLSAAVPEKKVTLRIYEPDNHLKKEMIAGSTGNLCVVPIYDSANRMHYVGCTQERRGSNYDYVHATLWGIDSDYMQETSARDKDGYPTEYDQPIYGIEHEDGNCYIVTGGYRTYIYGSGWNTGGLHGYPQKAIAFRFDIAANKAEVTNLSGGVFTGLSTQTEYAKRSDAYAALSVGGNHQRQEEAYHTTTVTTWAQTMEGILSRYLQRQLDGKSDLTIAAIYDNTNKEFMESEELTTLARTLSLRNVHLLFASQRTDSYGADLLSAYPQSAALSAEEANLMEGIRRYVLSDTTQQQGNRVLRLQPQNAQARLQNRYVLDPDTQYFYEYEIKGQTKAQDVLQIQYDYTAQASANPTNPYVVQAVYKEDFNDAETNAFFTLVAERIADGVYRGGWCYETRSKDAKNRYYSDTSELHFTVPAGRQAVLSFDYDRYADSNGALMSAGIWIDGVWWSVSSQLPYQTSGHYTHPQLLAEGEHTLKFIASDYDGRYIESHCTIDNLCVELVKQQSALSEGFAQADTSSSVTIADGWNQIRGAFTTPHATYDYAALKDVVYVQGELDMLSQITKEEDTCTVAVPEGSTLIWSALQTASRPYQSGKNRYNVSYALNQGEWSWSCSIERYTEDVMYNLPRDYALILTEKAKDQTIAVNYNSRQGAQGSIDSAQLVYTNTQQYAAPLSTQEWLLHEGQVLGKHQMFGNAADVILTPGAGDFQLRNFRLYSIRNGVKVYVTEEACPSAASGWVADTNLKMSIVQSNGKPEEETQQLVYQKGELISYGIHYFDYENDPSKKQYWRYTHTPFNDGPHPDAAFVLDEAETVISSTGQIVSAPIQRFYIDGKYTVEHWQEDNTTRGEQSSGQPVYDKQSNIETLTFYIASGGGNAPWVTSIATTPMPVKEGNAYKIRVSIDDAEKDTLSLTTEVYFEGRKIYTHRKTGIDADPTTRKYPVITTGTIPELAKPGTYDVVCTVRDWSGVGIGDYRFRVVSEGKIIGQVYHTDIWEANRKKYNLSKWGTEYNQTVTHTVYAAQSAPRKRGTNVFWSGEHFMLQAGVRGTPTSVVCQITGTSYKTTMRTDGSKNAAGETIYTGSIWHQDMINQWGRETPKELTFRFIATYSGGATKTHDVKVIVDTWENYYQLHRYF